MTGDGVTHSGNTQRLAVRLSRHAVPGVTPNAISLMRESIDAMEVDDMRPIPGSEKPNVIASGIKCGWPGCKEPATTTFYCGEHWNEYQRTMDAAAWYINPRRPRRLTPRDVSDK